MRVEGGSDLMWGLSAIEVLELYKEAALLLKLLQTNNHRVAYGTSPNRQQTHDYTARLNCLLTNYM